MSKLLLILILFQENDSLYARFLDEAPKAWNQSALTLEGKSYNVRCEITQEIVGKPNSETKGVLHFKRLGKLAVSESWIDGKVSRVFGINSEYVFNLELHPSGRLTIERVGDTEEVRNYVVGFYEGRVANPERDHISIAGRLYLPEVPWHDSNMVKCVGSRIVRMEQQEFVELKLEFDFDESFKLTTGVPASYLRSSTVLFDTENWLPRSSVSRYELKKQGVWYRLSWDIARDEMGRVRQIQYENEVFGAMTGLAKTTIDYVEWLPVLAKKTEFRLPHYGFPEYKSASNWFGRFTILGVIGAIVLAFLIAKYRSSR